MIIGSVSHFIGALYSLHHVFVFLLDSNIRSKLDILYIQYERKANGRRRFAA